MQSEYKHRLLVDGITTNNKPETETGSTSLSSETKIYNYVIHVAHGNSLPDKSQDRDDGVKLRVGGACDKNAAFCMLPLEISQQVFQNVVVSKSYL